MKRILKYLLIAIISFFVIGCSSDDNPTSSNSTVKDLLTDGIWEVAENTEIGESGYRLRFHSNGNLDKYDGKWKENLFLWELEDNDKTLLITETDDSPNPQYFEIEKITGAELVLISKSIEDEGKRVIFIKYI